MFDELKEVKYFNVIKGLNSLQIKGETHLEPKQASLIELFCLSSFVKIFISFIFSQKSSIIDAHLR